MRRLSFGVGAALAMAASLMSSGAMQLIGAERLPWSMMPITPMTTKPVKRRNKTTDHKPNGKREVSRRLRQVAAGQLTRSNGLVTAEELYGLKRAA